MPFFSKLSSKFSKQYDGTETGIEGGLTQSLSGSQTRQHSATSGEGQDRNSLTPGGESTLSKVVNENAEIKPRSLRFTLNMKTTSSRDRQGNFNHLLQGKKPVLDLPICQSGEGEAAVGKREPEEHQGGRVQGLLNAVDNVGQTAILPASIIGTPRWYCGPGQPCIGQGDGQANLLPHADLQPQVARYC